MADRRDLPAGVLCRAVRVTGLVDEWQSWVLAWCLELATCFLGFFFHWSSGQHPLSEGGSLLTGSCGKADPWLPALTRPLPPLLPVHSLIPQTPAWTLPAGSIRHLESTTEIAVGYLVVNKWYSEKLYETR